MNSLTRSVARPGREREKETHARCAGSRRAHALTNRGERVQNRKCSFPADFHLAEPRCCGVQLRYVVLTEPRLPPSFRKKMEVYIGNGTVTMLGHKEGVGGGGVEKARMKTDVTLLRTFQACFAWRYIDFLRWSLEVLQHKNFIGP